MTVKVVPENKWWRWRDVVLVGMTVVMGVMASALLSQARAQQSQSHALTEAQTQLSTIAAASEVRTRQIAALNAQLDLLRRQLAVKDARIKQLTDQLLRNGITPAPAPSPTVVYVSPSPSPSGARPSPTASPRPTSSPRPSSSPTPKPSPSPSPTSVLCRLHVTC